jgi:hypothetical protein
LLFGYFRIWAPPQKNTAPRGEASLRTGAGLVGRLVQPRGYYQAEHRGKAIRNSARRGYTGKTRQDQKSARMPAMTLPLPGHV